MANRYVWQNASGAANGTDWTNAYTSLPATLVRGDTYYVADGTYPAYTFNTALSGSTLVTIKKAIQTPGDHGTNTGWSEVMGDGQATFGNLVFRAGFVTFDGVVGGGPNSWNSGHGFKVVSAGGIAAVRPGESGFTCDSITLKHLKVETDFTQPTSPGFSIYCTNLTLSYVTIGTVGAQGLNISTGHGLLVEYSEIGEVGYYDAIVFPPSLEHSEWMSGGGLNVGMDNVVIRYSRFHDHRSTGGLMWGPFSGTSPYTSTNCDIYGNIFYGTGVIGIGEGTSAGILGGVQDTSNWNGFRFHHNTLFDINWGVGSARIITGGGTRTNVISRNNLLYNCTTHTSWGGDHDYNWFFNSGTTHTTEANKQLGSGDPFVNRAAFDLRLTANTTPGTPLAGTYGTDMFGNARTTWTRGAIEFNGAPAATRKAFIILG